MKPPALLVTALLAAPVPALASPLTTLYSFTDQADGGFPHAGLTPDRTSHAFYGTTTSGGAALNGTVYKLTPPAAGSTSWTQTTLYAFKGSPDGSVPYADLMQDKAGTLFGTTLQGGAGQGTVFELTPPAAGSTQWTETVLHSFTGGADGGQPQGKLIADRQGNLYGTASIGGTGAVGLVFELSPPPVGQTAWTETVLYNFTGQSDGGEPLGRLVFGADDALYGTTAGYGAYNLGTVYALNRHGSQWSLHVLHAFRGGTDGEVPRDGLIVDKAGTLYGTTAGFATAYGNVFRLEPPSVSGHGWHYSVLTNFTGAGFTGNGPWQTVSMDAKGHLFGTTLGDGTANAGTVFELSPPAPGNRAWTLKTLYDFNPATGSGFPFSTALPVGDTLFGTSFGYAGQSGFAPGNVWEITP